MDDWVEIPVDEELFLARLRRRSDLDGAEELRQRPELRRHFRQGSLSVQAEPNGARAERKPQPFRMNAPLPDA